VATFWDGRIRAAGCAIAGAFGRRLVADLRVDFVVLQAMQRSMVAVAERFEELGGQAREEARIWGGSHVRAAMGEFAENWRSHRGRLTEDLRKLGDGCGATVEMFQGVDVGLAGSAPGPTPR
jgi:hypothetical protein